MNITSLLTNIETAMRGYYEGTVTKLTALRDAIRSHTTDNSNPHRTDKEDVGLGLVQNFPVASSAEAIAGVSNNAYMTPLRVTEALGGVNYQELADAFDAAADQLENL